MEQLPAVPERDGKDYDGGIGTGIQYLCEAAAHDRLRQPLPELVEAYPPELVGTPAERLRHLVI